LGDCVLVLINLFFNIYSFLNIYSIKLLFLRVIKVTDAYSCLFRFDLPFLLMILILLLDAELLGGNVVHELHVGNVGLGRV